MPPTPGLADRPTLKQPAVNATNNIVQGAFSPMPGQPGASRIPTGQLVPKLSLNGPLSTPLVPGSPQAYASSRPGDIPLSPSALPVSPRVPVNRQLSPSASSLGYAALNQQSPNPVFSGPGMQRPGTPIPGSFSGRRADSELTDGPRSGGGSNQRPPRKAGSNGGERRKRRSFPIWARVLVGVLLLVVVLTGVGYGYYQVNFATAVNTITGKQVKRAAGEEDPNATLNGNILSGPRINILLLGSDTDQKFVTGTYIAQTDIVVTIDPASKTMGMLSIPRDFYINVPGYGMHKLDEAYGLGGVDLSRRTIEQDFGIPINYYAWVGLDGFIKVIDDVGGVDVDVIHPITDDQYPDDVASHANDPYAVKRLYLAPGPQHLGGQTALSYVRSRHADLVGDFGRSARQQQVLAALKPKLENPNVVGKLSTIANDLKGFLTTDLALPDVLKLMNFARGLDLNNINRLILGPPYSTSGTATDGADKGSDVVFPDCAKIIPAIAQMLQLGNNAACNVQANSSQSAPVAVAGMQTTATAALCTIYSSAVSSLGADMSNPIAGMTTDAYDMLGIHSLLNLLFLGVFETPDALSL